MPYDRPVNRSFRSVVVVLGIGSASGAALILWPDSWAPDQPATLFLAVTTIVAITTLVLQHLQIQQNAAMMERLSERLEDLAHAQAVAAAHIERQAIYMRTTAQVNTITGTTILNPQLPNMANRARREADEVIQEGREEVDAVLIPEHPREARRHP